MRETIHVVGTLDSINTSIQNGILLWCTDGFFDRIMMPTVSSAGWMIFDPTTKNYIHGSFYEISGAQLLDHI